MREYMESELPETFDRDEANQGNPSPINMLRFLDLALNDFNAFEREVLARGNNGTHTRN